MSRKNKKTTSQRRKDQVRRSTQKLLKGQKSRRSAAVIDGKTKAIYSQPDGRGYNVKMIGDFLEHLLLELRVQQFEEQKYLRVLEDTNDIEAANAAASEVSEPLVEQFVKFHEEYATALISTDVFDREGATENETLNARVGVLMWKGKLRDEQILHMEALQSLFDEALQCAKVPFGFGENGERVGPMNVHSVREMCDRINEAPDYDELVRQLDGHSPFTDRNIEALQKATIIVATNDAFEKDLIVFGRAECERIGKSGEEDTLGLLSAEVAEATGLQLLVAAVQKFKGRHDYHGNYYDEF